MGDETRREEIRARLANATPGPWEQDVDSTAVATARDLDLVCNLPDRDEARMMADADLIANAPTDLAFLLDELSRAEAARDAAMVVLMQAHAGFVSAFQGPDWDVIQEARAFQARVRAFLSDPEGEPSQEKEPK